MNLANSEHLWPHPQRLEAAEDFPAPAGIAVEDGTLPSGFNDELRAVSQNAGGSAEHTIRSSVDEGMEHPEGYRLTVAPSGTTLVGRDAAGLAHGAQTLRRRPSTN